MPLPKYLKLTKEANAKLADASQAMENTIGKIQSDPQLAENIKEKLNRTGNPRSPNKETQQRPTRSKDDRGRTR